MPGQTLGVSLSMPPTNLARQGTSRAAAGEPAGWLALQACGARLAPRRPGSAMYEGKAPWPSAFAGYLRRCPKRPARVDAREGVQLVIEYREVRPLQLERAELRVVPSPGRAWCCGSCQTRHELVPAGDARRPGCSYGSLVRPVAR